MSCYISVLTKNYANFKDRARRREYWMFFLFNFILGFIISLAAGMAEITFLPVIYYLAVLIPSLAVTVRRLHDIGKSGVWIFISLIPLVGGIWMLILMCKEGVSDINAYGRNPKAL